MKPLKQVNALGLAGGYRDGWEVKSVEIDRWLITSTSTCINCLSRFYLLTPWTIVSIV